MLDIVTFMKTVSTSSNLFQTFVDEMFACAENSEQEQIAFDSSQKKNMEMYDAQVGVRFA